MSQNALKHFDFIIKRPVGGPNRDAGLGCGGKVAFQA
jgi:hypothetical protein